MKVMRWVLNFSTQLATTRRWRSFSAEVPGKREAHMSVGSHAQKDQIKAGELSWREMEKFFQGLLILQGRIVRIFSSA